MKDKPQKAIGHKDELDEERLAGKHIDGATGFVFETEEDYLAFKHPEVEEKKEEENRDADTPAEPDHKENVEEGKEKKDR